MNTIAIIIISLTVCVSLDAKSLRLRSGYNVDTSYNGRRDKSDKGIVNVIAIKDWKIKYPKDQTSSRVDNFLGDALCSSCCKLSGQMKDNCILKYCANFKNPCSPMWKREKQGEVIVKLMGPENLDRKPAAL